MPPNEHNRQNTLQPSTAPVTGSQLEEQAAAASWQNTQKKLKIGIGVGAGVLLILSAAVIFLMFTLKPNPDAAPTNMPAKNQSSSTPAAQQPPAPAASIYAEQDYQSSTGQKFQVTYFGDAQIKRQCELALYAGRCLSSASTLYLSGTRDNRQPLLFSIEDASSVSQPDYCPAVAFTATLNNKATPVCKQDLGGKVFKYTFTFTVKGTKYLGIFIMDNPANGSFLDASQYEKDIKVFVPAIKVYL